MTLRRPMYCHFLLTLCRFLNDFMSARCAVIFFEFWSADKNEFMSDRCKVIFYVITSTIKKMTQRRPDDMSLYSDFTSV
jgi:hypothetical protein